MLRAFIILASLVSLAAAAPGRGPFKTVGSRTFDSDNNWVVFRGMSVTCTEYMARPGYPADFGWGCFGAAPTPNASLQLNDEPAKLAKYLRKDTDGGSFQTHPTVAKVAWPAPYDQVLTPGSPFVVPTVRMPVTSGSYMYDIDANAITAEGYRTVLDLLITNLTTQGIAVIIDQHGCCAGSAINCSSWAGPMALRDFGNLSGALAFWDMVSKRYEGNDLVFYELYNEPHTWFQALQGGDARYAGMTEMYQAVRNNAPSALVVIAGNGYAQSSADLIAIQMAFTRDNKGGPMTNVLWNLHPYQGMFQGVWIALRSTLRLTLALQTMGPVIYTEAGQYCCNSNNTGQPVGGRCNDHPHGDWFVHNLINMASQLDVSWTGWAWRGTAGGNCGSPDMRAAGPEGLLTNGSMGGANWEEVWGTYVASPQVTIVSAGDDHDIGVNATEVKGFLPKPCIVPEFGMGDSCGWPLGFNTSLLPWNSLWNQSVGESVLPGLPPAGPPSACYSQACPGYTCSNSSPIVPMPQPCSP